jgi:hypothetical protein
VRIAELAATVELNGQIIPDPETSGRVQAMFAGSVIPGPKGMPTAGRKVAKGEVLAYLRPISGAIERGNQKASLAELEAQLAIAEGKMKRFEQLEGAVPQKEIEAARIEHAALQQRRAYVHASIDSAEALVAPAWLASSAPRITYWPGRSSMPRRCCSRSSIPPASPWRRWPTMSASPKRWFPPAPWRSRRRWNSSSSAAASNCASRPLPLLFRIANRNAAVAVGQPVKVIVRTEQGVKGASAPRTALTKVGAGETAVWVHTEAERFRRSPDSPPVARCGQRRHPRRPSRRRPRGDRSEPDCFRRCADMFDYIIHAALKQRLIVLGISLLLIIYGAITLRQMPVDVFPDLNRPTVTHHDRGGGPWRRRRWSNSSPIPIETQHERHAGRDARALDVGDRPVHRLCRVRLGHGHLPQPPADRRTAERSSSRSPADRGRAADGPDLVDHGPDHADGR